MIEIDPFAAPARIRLRFARAGIGRAALCVVALEDADTGARLGAGTRHAVAGWLEDHGYQWEPGTNGVWECIG